MTLITDKPEDLKSTNALDEIEDPDAPRPAGERAEIYLSGAHVCTLDNAPTNRQTITLMVEVEVTEESVRANGDADVPIRRCRRIGDMWIPGTQRPPTKEEAKAEVIAAKAKAAKEAADREEAERAEQEHNEPPMFDEDGEPINHDAPPPTDDAEDGPADDEEDQDAGDDSNVVQFSDGAKKP